MVTKARAVRPVLLVGSVPLPTAKDVFESVGHHLKGAIQQIPDGETGDRLYWVGSSLEQLANTPGIERVPGDALGQLRLKPGVSASDIALTTLHYHEVAQRSFVTFKQAKAEGKVDPEVRFQVSIPTPLAFVMLVDGPTAGLLALFERVLLADLKKIVEVIPSADLAIQWDLAAETVVEECRENRAARDEAHTLPSDLLTRWTFEEAMAAAARLFDAVPSGVPAGAHLCFGDRGGKPYVQPSDASVMTRIANDLNARLARPLAWLHMPVPPDCRPSFFEPLSNLKLPKSTQLYLGLISHADGLLDAIQRMDMAKQFVTDFGVSSECGLGRRPPESIQALLDAHLQAALIT
jgi:hypothetical protein